jgi:ABC-type nickel/cobalt efflux system permease component RcnA
MPSLLTPASEHYLIHWSVALAGAGLVLVLLGLFGGWIIWRNARRMTIDIEEKNRAALCDYEKTSEEISRIKSELSSGGR